MSNVLNRSTKQYLRSVNTPDYPVADWIINPDMSAVSGLAARDIVIDGDTVRPMNETEKAEELPARKAELEREIALAANSYGQQYFPAEIEVKLKLLHQQAVSSGLTNRAAYIQQAVDFETVVIAEMQSRISSVRAITQWSELDGDWTNFTALDTQAPDVTVAGALEITD